ncbi:MAG TPA: cytochrome C oxidase subunit I [Bacteroidia bacterium]|nr:cytochrome C oxidase subunit I [Bacteroidia bacterium]MBP7714776.1 cytochrome C oxidase subunit I [Bacteroidia bacterium]MBP8668358.1 cytochrome C oxidase subunit I [Bacteroidia bacterium]HOZ82972.1 cytochrome C oxidase subunit I [Bacteroidia bacterium]HQW16565.1 cytochrome C oxidase subunit I [Bacteroidia bacterium]
MIISDSIKTTSYKVVLPFYIYAAFAFLLSAILLLTSSSAFTDHYFQPHILAITHLMALGWGTMIILGASHQLVPVLIEGKLYSNALAYASFILAGIGIPLLVYGFYVFNMHNPAKWGGRFILLSIIAYLINLGVSMSKSKKENIHALFVFTSALWLFLTGALGLALVYNFTYNMFPHDSLHYLPLHVHAGVIGWFLMLIIGVGSRLIPMFLISKYTNTKLLKWIFVLINGALISYILIFYFVKITEVILLPWLMLFTGIALFIFYCYSAFKHRIRKQVDEPMKVSLLAVMLLMIPLLLLLISIVSAVIFSQEDIALSLSYGFLIFFGWITAIILGMTFKTLPFIVWNKVYHKRSGIGKTPNPKDLFSNTVFKLMSVAYIAGLLLFVTGSLMIHLLLIKCGAVLLLMAAALYVFNVLKVITHKPQQL